MDMDHFKDYMKSVIRAFKTPSVMGFKPVYKTDYIWVTVQCPPNMWTEDMSQEVYTALAGYVTSEVSRTITVRVTESRDAMDNTNTSSRRKSKSLRHGSITTKCNCSTANQPISKDTSQDHTYLNTALQQHK